MLSKPTPVSSPFPVGRLAEAVVRVRCVTADAPIALIALNDLSRTLADRCADWVDVSGRTYGVDKSPPVHGHLVPRYRNQKWQRDLRRYLGSGQAVILIRPATGENRATVRAVERGGLLARQDGFAVYWTHRRYRLQPVG
jgi:hypothetical protein